MKSNNIIKNFRKHVSLILTLCMVFTLCAVSISVGAAEKNEAGSKMIHISGSKDSSVRVSLAGSLEKGAAYNVYFKYKMIKGRLDCGNGNTIRFVDYYNNNYRHHSTHVPAGSSDFQESFTSLTDGTDKYNDMSLSFTARESGSHSLGFDLTGDSDFYIADFTVKNSADEIIASGVDGFKAFKGTPTVETETYKDEYFLTANNRNMIHISGTKGNVGVTFYEFPVNDYTVYFKYKIVKGRLDNGAGHTIRFADYYANDYRHFSTHVLAGSSEYEAFTTLTGGTEEYNDMALSFTLKQKGKHSFVFCLLGESELYVSDFVIKDSKGNVIISGVEGFDLTTSDASLSKEILPYNDDYFLTENNSKVLHIASDANANWGTEKMQAIGTRLPLTAGNKYNVHFKYRLKRGVFDSSERVSVMFCDWYSSFEWRHYTTHENNPAYMFETDNKAGSITSEMNLSFTAKTGTASHTLGFAFVGLGELYITDFVVTDANGNVICDGFGSFTVSSSSKLKVNDVQAYDASAAAAGWHIYSGVGGSLESTEDNGTFKVNGGLTAKAVNAETGDAYLSIKEYLTLPKGVYDIEYIPDTYIVNTYYVSQNGSDSNDGLTAGTALKTVAKAVEIASNTAKIKILDTAKYDITNNYNKNITINGGVLKGDKNITLYSDLILENTVIDAENILAGNHTLIIGESVSYSNGKPSVTSGERLIINSGDFENIRITGDSVTKLYAYGSTVENIIISSSSADAIVKVNVEGDALLSFADGAKYKTAEIIFNKSAKKASGAGENTRIIASEKSGNSRVDFSGTNGKYVLTTEKGKTPVAVSENGEKIYAADSFDYDYGKVDINDNALNNYNKFINYRNGIPNTYKKLMNGQKLNVVYFGGSVTAGAGLPSEGDREIDSWRAKVGNWLNENFPNSNIVNINKSLGESGSYLGVYRLPYIIAEKPDLLFIEYAINDYYYKASYEQAAAQFEAIVRSVKKALPNCDIVTLLVTEKSMYDSSSKGELHTAAQAHEDISAYYNIPSLKLGCALTSRIDFSDWGTYFSDVVHPTAKGYQVYYNCIEEFMTNALLNANYSDNNTFVMPPVKNTYVFDGALSSTGVTAEILKDSEKAGGSGFVQKDIVDWQGELNGYVSASDVGSTFIYKFYGTEISLYTNKTTSASFPYISIDGGANISTEIRDLAHNPIKVASNLEPGWHTVKVTTVEANTKISGIYVADSTKHTLRGNGADGTYKYANLSLETGAYNVKYLTSSAVSQIKAPEKEGYDFIGWADENGNIVTEITAGSVLTASYKSSSSQPGNPDNPGNTDNTGNSDNAGNGGNTGDSETPTNPANPENSENPKTGDSSNAALWFGIMCLSVIALTGFRAYKRRAKK